MKNLSRSFQEILWLCFGLWNITGNKCLLFQKASVTGGRTAAYND